MKDQLESTFLKWGLKVMRGEERRLAQCFPISCHYCLFYPLSGMPLEATQMEGHCLWWLDCPWAKWRKLCVPSYLKRLCIILSQAANPTLVICFSWEMGKKQSSADLL